MKFNYVNVHKSFNIFLCMGLIHISRKILNFCVAHIVAENLVGTLCQRLTYPI